MTTIVYSNLRDTMGVVTSNPILNTLHAAGRAQRRLQDRINAVRDEKLAKAQRIALAKVERKRAASERATAKRKAARGAKRRERTGMWDFISLGALTRAASCVAAGARCAMADCDTECIRAVDYAWRDTLAERYGRSVIRRAATADHTMRAHGGMALRHASWEDIYQTAAMLHVAAQGAMSTRRALQLATKRTLHGAITRLVCGSDNLDADALHASLSQWRRYSPAESVQAYLVTLSQEQRGVWEALAEGLTERDIAVGIGRSPKYVHTVICKMREALEKLL